MASLADIGAVPLAEMREELAGCARGIPLHGRGGVIRAFAMVDADEYERRAGESWCLDVHGYVFRGVGPRNARRMLRLGRVVMGLERGDGREVDHRNRDRLDNRRAKLRVVTRGQNMQNVPPKGRTSPYRGVSWDTQRGKWCARCQLDGRPYHLGYFSDEEEAAEAALQWRRDHMPYAID